MSKKVIVELTFAEAMALWSAGNCSIGSAASQEEALAVLSNMASVRAGERALDKLKEAARRANPSEFNTEA